MADKPKHDKEEKVKGQPRKSLLKPEPNTPMGKFNAAMRKILSVPKKDIKKK
jgi:hypothetical protein